MKIWKRIALFLLALTILASFAACQVTKTTASTKDETHSTKPAKTTAKTSKTTESTPAATASQTISTAATTPEQPAVTEPSTEAVEDPVGEAGDSYTSGAAIGKMLQSRLANIPEINLDALYETAIGQPQIGTTTELLLEGSLFVDGAEDIFADMLSDFSSYITVETQEDTQYISLEQDFPSIENSQFFVEALATEDELYLSLPYCFDHIVSLPLNEMIQQEYENFAADTQLAEEMLTELSQNASEVANALIALLGDSLNAMFTALPDDCITQSETTVEFDTETVNATTVTIDLPPQKQPLVVTTLLEAIPQSASFLPFCEAFFAMAEATGTDAPYRSAQEFADELTVEIYDLVEELREVEYTEGPNVSLELSFDDVRIYALNITLYAENGEAVYFSYYNDLTKTDGAIGIQIVAGNASTLYGALDFYFGFLDSGEFKCSIDIELSENVADEALDISLATYSYDDENGIPCIELYGELMLGEDSFITFECYVQTEADGEDVYYYVQIPSLVIVVDGYTAVEGELFLTALTYENEEVNTYTVDDAITLDELANSEELLTELAEGLCKNPILAILVEGMN